MTAKNEIDALTKRFFGLFNNVGGKRVDLSAIQDLLILNVSITKLAQEKSEAMTLEQFSTPREELLNGGSIAEFHEYEIEAKTEISNNIAHRWLVYEKQWMQDGIQKTGRGTKSIQFEKRNGQWLISSILWEDQP